IAGTAAAGGNLFGNLTGDPLGLVLMPAISHHADRFTRIVFGEEGFLLPAQVVRNKFVGHSQDTLRAAIVLLQANDADLGKILFKIEDVAQVGPSPAINRLVRVARHCQVRMVDRKRPGDHILGQVRVLILVDHDETVSLVEARPNFGALPEQGGYVQQEIVEIDGVRTDELRLISWINSLNYASQGVSMFRLILIRSNKIILGPANGSGYGLGRGKRGINAQLADHAAEG